MLKLKFGLLIIVCFLLANCKTEKEPEQYKSELSLSKNLSDFTKVMTEKDTLKILAQLYMEWWVREDELIITKENEKIQMQVKIKEDTTFEMKYEWRINRLPKITIQNENRELENHFVQKIERTKGRNDRGRIYKLMSSNDTLTFYTDGLGDKGGEVRDYYKLMHKYYPNEMDFLPFEKRYPNE